MGVKEILGYICLAGGVILFVAMYLIPKIRSHERRESPLKKSEL